MKVVTLVAEGDCTAVQSDGGVAHKHSKDVCRRCFRVVPEIQSLQEGKLIGRGHEGLEAPYVGGGRSASNVDGSQRRREGRLWDGQAKTDQQIDTSFVRATQ